MSHCLEKMVCNKKFFLWHQAWPHNDLILFKTILSIYGLQYPWSCCTARPWTKKKIELLATKFSEKFGLSMFKKHRKFCRRGLAHLDPTPIFKNHSDDYETPCKCFYKTGTRHNNIHIECRVVKRYPIIDLWRTQCQL